MHRSEEEPPVLPGLAAPAPAPALSGREAQVLHLIARGLSNQEIADTIFLSINSVKTYIRSAYRKIGASRRSQAVVWALRHGLDGGEHATFHGELHADAVGTAPARSGRPLVSPPE